MVGVEVACPTDEQGAREDICPAPAACVQQSPPNIAKESH